MDFKPAWLPNVRGYSKRTVDDKRVAEANHRQTHVTLRTLQRSVKAGNVGCADCDSKQSGWAALPHGVFLCIDCAQVHRSIGRHISQVKAVSTGTYTWFDDEVAAMQEMGNGRADRLYCGRPGAPAKPPSAAARFQKEQYITNKYVRLKWAVRDARSSSARGPRTRSPAASPRVVKKATSSCTARPGSGSPHGGDAHGGDTPGAEGPTDCYTDQLHRLKKASPPAGQEQRAKSKTSLLDDAGDLNACRSNLHRPLIPTKQHQHQYQQLPAADFFADFGL